MKVKNTKCNELITRCNRRHNRKSYTITTVCGEKFGAVAMGKRGYRCRGRDFDTLKEIKNWIEGMSEDDPTNDIDCDNNKSPMWDCVDPCALLIRLGHEMGLSHKALETLDKYGWLTEEGLPDLEKVDKEFKRVYG